MIETHTYSRASPGQFFFGGGVLRTLLSGLTVRPSPLGSAGACVAINAISAGAAVLAGAADALVHILVAVGARPAVLTHAYVTSDSTLQDRKCQSLGTGHPIISSQTGRLKRDCG